MALGTIWLNPPLSGRWTLPTFPDEIAVGECRFRRALWSASSPGVVAQYREAVRHWSRHLKVGANGTWVIDHVDEVNPDRGSPTSPVEHLIADHSFGKALKAFAVVGSIGALSYLAVLSVRALAKA